MGDRTRGVTPRRRQHWGVEPDPAPKAEHAERWTSAEERAAARRILWRDSATILAGVIIALLAFQMFLRGGGGVGPASDGTGLPSGLIAASAGPPSAAAPGQTMGPILDPSLGVGVPPTRSPVRTLPPTGSQRPASPAPHVTPRPPTPRPPAPSPTESPPPTAPSPTESPLPTAPLPTESPLPTAPSSTEPAQSLPPSSAVLP